MIFLLLAPPVLLAFVIYRKYNVSRLLKEARKSYAISIAHRVENKSHVLNFSTRGRIYFLENEILNFKHGMFNEVEQIVVPGAGKKKRSGVLGGNFSTLDEIHIRDGVLEIQASPAESSTRTLRATLQEKETEVIQKWIVKFFQP